VVGAYRAGARIAEAIPVAAVPPVGRIGGRVGGWPQRKNRRMAARHQHRVTGRTDRRVVDEVFEFYGRYWLEMLRLPAEVRAGAIVPNFTIEGYDRVTDSLARGKGAILALPHLGGWEWRAAWMGEQGHDMLAVVEAVEPPELLDWFARQREAMGLEVVALGPDAGTRVLRALRDNRIVCLVCDRNLSGDGVEVKSSARKPRCPRDPRPSHCVLARRSCPWPSTSSRGAGIAPW